jgi:hypothetical protein
MRVVLDLFAVVMILNLGARNRKESLSTGFGFLNCYSDSKSRILIPSREIPLCADTSGLSGVTWFGLRPKVASRPFRTTLLCLSCESLNSGTSVDVLRAAQARASLGYRYRYVMCCDVGLSMYGTGSLECKGSKGGGTHFWRDRPWTVACGRQPVTLLPISNQEGDL